MRTTKDNLPHASFVLPAVLRVREYLGKYQLRSVKSHEAQRAASGRERVPVLRDSQGSRITIDHVIPLVRGGESTWTNLVAACAKCNNRKGAQAPKRHGDDT